MPTRLIRLITMQKVLKTCSNKSAKQHCLDSNHTSYKLEIFLDLGSRNGPHRWICHEKSSYLDEFC